MVIRTAHPDDAPAMGRVMVDTFLAAHRGQMPEEAWNKRKAEWTYEVSARSWESSLQEMVQDSPVLECIYVAEDESGDIVGLAMGVPSEMQGAGSADQIGEICALYVRQSCQGQGIGKKLVEAVASHLAKGGIATLNIAVLKANAPARRFYEAIGGQLIDEREFDEEGFLLSEVVYGWSDITVLINNP